MPAASDDLMHSFYPLLANAMIQADLNSVEDEGSAAIGMLADSCRAPFHQTTLLRMLRIVSCAGHFANPGKTLRTMLRYFLHAGREGVAQYSTSRQGFPPDAPPQFCLSTVMQPRRQRRQRRSPASRTRSSWSCWSRTRSRGG